MGVPRLCSFRFRYLFLSPQLDSFRTHKKNKKVKKMKVICFIGDKKTGKSTTIKKILNDFFKVDILAPKIRRDFSLSFKYKDKLVGICSYGDTETWLIKMLMPLKDKNCDIIICAAHPPKSKTIKFIKDNFSDITEIKCQGMATEEDWNIEHLSIR